MSVCRLDIKVYDFSDDKIIYESVKQGNDDFTRPKSFSR
jgi:hypothetical protein